MICFRIKFPLNGDSVGDECMLSTAMTATLSLSLTLFQLEFLSISFSTKRNREKTQRNCGLSFNTMCSCIPSIVARDAMNDVDNAQWSGKSVSISICWTSCKFNNTIDWSFGRAHCRTLILTFSIAPSTEIRWVEWHFVVSTVRFYQTFNVLHSMWVSAANTHTHAGMHTLRMHSIAVLGLLISCWSTNSKLDRRLQRRRHFHGNRNRVRAIDVCFANLSIYAFPLAAMFHCFSLLFFPVRNT